MIHLPKSVLSLGVLVLTAGAILLTAPHMGHAAAALLVQVTNTAASPAVTQDVGRQASQLAHLSGTFTPGFNVLYAANSGGTPYLTPAAQSLVVTSVDIEPGSDPSYAGCGANTVSTVTLLSPANSPVKQWMISGATTTHFTYPSGLVIGPNSAPVIALPSSLGCSLAIDVVGYLTTN